MIPKTKTHMLRAVWLPTYQGDGIGAIRQRYKPGSADPLFWECAGHGFGGVEDPTCLIGPRTINTAFERA